MKLLAGLGNPGARYERTRHNVGFMALDAFVGRLQAEVSWAERFNARMARVRWRGDDLILLKPQTFMNLSGLAVGEAVRFYRVTLDELLIAHDDVDLPLGRVMVKRGGGDAGHKGVRSLMENLGSLDFARVRIGIGRPEGDESVEDFVLRPFDDSEADMVTEALKKAVDAMTAWVAEGVSAAQNRVNRRERQAAPKHPEGTPCPETHVVSGPQDREEVQ